MGRPACGREFRRRPATARSRPSARRPAGAAATAAGARESPAASAGAGPPTGRRWPRPTAWRGRRRRRPASASGSRRRSRGSGRRACSPTRSAAATRSLRPGRRSRVPKRRSPPTARAPPAPARSPGRGASRAADLGGDRRQRLVERSDLDRRTSGGRPGSDRCRARSRAPCCACSGRGWPGRRRSGAGSWSRACALPVWFSAGRSSSNAFWDPRGCPGSPTDRCASSGPPRR